MLKLSDETWKEPEHEGFEVFVVMVEVLIASEKVTDIVEFLAMTEVAELEGEVELTVGPVES